LKNLIISAKYDIVIPPTYKIVKYTIIGNNVKTAAPTINKNPQMFIVFRISQSLKTILNNVFQIFENHHE
jgi:hypothetical protein